MRYQIFYVPSGYDIHRASHGLLMALIEIDGLPFLNMVDLAMAMLVITRWYVHQYAQTGSLLSNMSV